MIRQCITCGAKIFFKKNSDGKFVPFDYVDGSCHFATCKVPKNAGIDLYFERKKAKENKSIIEFAE